MGQRWPRWFRSDGVVLRIPRPRYCIVKKPPSDSYFDGGLIRGLLFFFACRSGRLFGSGAFQDAPASILPESFADQLILPSNF